MKIKIKFFVLGLLCAGALASPIIMGYYRTQAQLQHLEDRIENVDEYFIDELNYLYGELEDINQ